MTHKPRVIREAEAALRAAQERRDDAHLRRMYPKLHELANSVPVAEEQRDYGDEHEERPS